MRSSSQRRPKARHAVLVGLAVTLVACGSATSPQGTAPPASRSAQPNASASPRAHASPVIPPSDPFIATALDSSWQMLHPELVGVTAGGGHLVLTLRDPALWFEDSEAAQVSRPVTGDFVVTATVGVDRGTPSAHEVSGRVWFGGLMARDPASHSGGHEQYVHVVVGWDGNRQVLETKSTRDSTSDYTDSDWSSPEAQVRICRIGDTFTLLRRSSAGERWTAAKAYARPDMPDTLAVGPSLYATGFPPNLTVTYGPVTFAAAADNGACTAG